MQHSAAFGSYVESVGTIASVLFALINRCGYYDVKPRDSTIIRQAKIVYVSLLESVQKERGEWQGFISSIDSRAPIVAEELETLSPRNLLLSKLKNNSTPSQLSVLNEILDVSLRNLMGPIVPFELYTRQRKLLLSESLAVPPSLSALLAIRGIVENLEHEVRHCLLRLFAMWDLIALVNSDFQSLLKTIANKYQHILSDSSDIESMTARKSERQDQVAIHLLHVMVLYRDILFSDLEFIVTKQELQINPRVLETSRASAWPLNFEFVASIEDKDDQFSSDLDSRSSGSEKLQTLYVDTALQPQDVDATEGRDWSIPSLHYSHHFEDEQKTLRSRKCDISHAVSRNRGVAASGPLLLPSGEASAPSSGHSLSQQSLATTSDSPTHSVLSPASSSVRSLSHLVLRRTRHNSSSSFSSKELHDRQHQWQDTARSETQSPLPPTSTRSSSSRRKRGMEKVFAPRYQSTDQKMRGTERVAARQSFSSKVATSLVIPVAAATLCVVATLSTLAIYEMRRSSRI